MRNLATSVITAGIMVCALATARCAHSGGARAAECTVRVTVLDLESGESRVGTGWVHRGIVYTAGHMLWGIGRSTLGAIVAIDGKVCKVRAMEAGQASDVAVMVPECDIGNGMRIAKTPAVVGETLCWTSRNRGVPVESCGNVAEVAGQWIAVDAGIQNGHSGSPLYRSDGRVVGIVSRGDAGVMLAIRIEALEVSP